MDVSNALKEIGPPALTVLSLVLLFVATRMLRNLIPIVRLFDKLRKLPEQPLSKAAFEKWCESVLWPKLQDLEATDQKLRVSVGELHERVRRVWNASGVSNERMEAFHWEDEGQPREPTEKRFNTQGMPVFVPATEKPPPPALRGGPRKNYAFDEDERDSTPVTPWARDGKKK